VDYIAPYPEWVPITPPPLNRPLAQTRFRQHDPNGEFLFPVYDAIETPPDPATRSLPLFDDVGPDST
jgi:hypothetical protein